jgi:hypothetical protein
VCVCVLTFPRLPRLPRPFRSLCPDGLGREFPKTPKTPKASVELCGLGKARQVANTSQGRKFRRGLGTHGSLGNPRPPQDCRGTNSQRLLGVLGILGATARLDVGHFCLHLPMSGAVVSPLPLPRAPRLSVACSRVGGRGASSQEPSANLGPPQLLYSTAPARILRARCGGQEEPCGGTGRNVQAGRVPAPPRATCILVGTEGAGPRVLCKLVAQPPLPETWFIIVGGGVSAHCTIWHLPTLQKELRPEPSAVPE